MSSNGYPNDNLDDDGSITLLRKPSLLFLDTPIGSFKGANSLHNFASSFTRAQSFAASKIDNGIHKSRSFFHEDKDVGAPYDELFDPGLMVPSSKGRRLSLAVQETGGRQQPPAAGYSSISPNEDVFYQEDALDRMNLSRDNSISAYKPPKNRMFVSPSFSSFSSSLSHLTTASKVQLKKIEDKDGKVVTILAGQSTAPQTIFNSINVLIGIGLLALPVGFLRGGLVFGIILMVVCGYVTHWTATLLSKAMDTDKTIMTYADLGHASYGPKAKFVIMLLFSIDLIGAGVSLFVLFSDSLYALIGDENILTKTNLKIISFFVLTPFSFMPLSILSIFSLFGISSTISITLLVLFCGIIKNTRPGSLINYMPPNLWPDSWQDLLLSIGLIMAPFSGHAIFPNLKADMRHPEKFTGTLSTTYIITLLTDMSMAILGFLMFGKYCNNEITNNILTTEGYPSWLYVLLSGLTCVIPLAKTPLNAKPIISSLDDILHLTSHTSSSVLGFFQSMGKFFTRIFVNGIFVLLAILFPQFEKVIGLTGASICFLIAVILPCMFYYKLCGHTISALEKAVVIAVIVVSFLLAVVATMAVIIF